MDAMAIVQEIRELRGLVQQLVETRAARSEGEAAAHGAGLLSYEDLQDRLTIGRKKPRVPSMRRVKQIVKENRSLLKPVKVGECSIGFTESRVLLLIERMGEKGANS